MPKSRVRKKAAYTAPAATVSNHKKYGQPWVGPVMVALFLIGVAWLVVYYLGNGNAPIGAIKQWNLAVGFGFLIAGFALSTRWR